MLCLHPRKIAVVVLGIALLAASASSAEAQTVCTDSDPSLIRSNGVPAVCGKSLTKAPVFAYLGIPYASPPVGALRWQPPRATTWPPEAAVQRVAYGHLCAQDSPRQKSLWEDCLYLNVWTPRSAINTRSTLPVMVFIHGGAFVTGGSSPPYDYDGSVLASQGTVVVTLNYRLGALGFLVADIPGRSSSSQRLGGNLGLMDQQTALTWVKKNIQAFGGDPTRITLFGESAGGMSVGLHTFSVPSSAELFSAALMESNPMGMSYQTPASAIDHGAAFLKNLCATVKKAPSPCPVSLEWLQQTPSTVEILQAQQAAMGLDPKAARPAEPGLLKFLDTFPLNPNQPWAPIVDGSLVTRQPYAGYLDGAEPKPLVFGVNRDESAPFVQAKYNARAKEFNQDKYLALLLEKFGEASRTKILSFARYNPKQQKDQGYYNATAVAFSNLATDYVFTCGNIAVAKAMPVGRAWSVFGYEFTQAPFFNLYPGLGACAPSTGNVCHGNELPYVFDNFSAASTTKPPSGDSELAQTMVAAWTNFAKNPSEPQEWLRYTAQGAVTQWNSKNKDPIMLDADANCSALWLTLPPYSTRQK